MIKIEILMSVMNQSDLSIAKKANANADILIINQCDHDGYVEELYNGYRIRMISTTERGLSRSRNMAIKNALGDICIFCDDDERYVNGYKDNVINAFNKKKKADIIAFNVRHINVRNKRKMHKKFKKAPKFKTYGSWCLAFRLDEIRNKSIFFNVNFGAGSEKINHGEESVWQYKAKKNGLKIYQHPFCIVNVQQSDSTWFHGYNNKYFYDMGAYVREVFPVLKCVFKYYYVFRLHSRTQLTICEQLKWLNSGIRGYEKELSFDEYIRRKV